MQATRPSELIAPLQIGRHHFASKFLIHIPKLSNLKQTLQHFKEQIYLAVLMEALCNMLQTTSTIM
jgi:hypothetical protein